MTNPRFNEDQLWERIISLNGKTIQTLEEGNVHTIIDIDRRKLEYKIVYNKTNKSAAVKFKELYIMYKELYKNGSMLRNYMEENSQRFVGHKWRQPGASMYAILPQLDDAIKFRKVKGKTNQIIG
jgi:hypothetical protein